MKEEYKQPTTTIVRLRPRTTVLTGSYGSGVDVTGIDENPGDQEDFG